ncbi:TPA: hypothetical protein DDZ10_02885, partial [Candidatus Uhrbacteria bacterium]|nr:hypothetical protein [Candidatus Uhrbacteria bacterium]
MLSRAQEKLIKSVQTKKGRETSGLVLVEGEKLIAEAGARVEFRFDENDSPRFAELVTTVTPQMKAALARLPVASLKDVLKKKTVVVLDHVQDPGNLGTILRSALAFDAGLVLIECADVGNPKVIRGSAGAVFHTPWTEMGRAEAETWLAKCEKLLYRLELAPDAIALSDLPDQPILIIAGSEGQGIVLDVKAPSVKIP